MRRQFTFLLWIFGLSLTVVQAQSYSGKELFKAHFHPKPLRALDSNPTSFQLGTKELQRLKRDSTELYKAIGLLKSGKAVQALPTLKNLAERMKETVSNVSEWYLAMAYLALERKPQAEYVLHKIAETELHPYQDEAEVVFQKLIGLR